MGCSETISSCAGVECISLAGEQMGGHTGLPFCWAMSVKEGRGGGVVVITLSWRWALVVFQMKGVVEKDDGGSGGKLLIL